MGTIQQASPKWTLNKTDFLSWGKWSLAMASPAIIVYLTALESGTDPKVALGMLSQGLLGSAIYLFKRFQDQ